MTRPATRDPVIDYAPCRYNASRLWFRGPRRPLRQPYVACLGGCETYGRYLREPWPALLEAAVAQRVVNLGVENAGIDAYLNDPGALATAAKARVSIIQLGCGQNTSNRFYAVHPRRNDRFLKASDALKSLYPEMDFTEVHFTGHLLQRLRSICPDRFALVRQEVQEAWRARMRHLIGQLDGAVVLLWFNPVPLADAGKGSTGGETFLSRKTIQSFSPHVRAIVEVVPANWRAGSDRMVVPPFEAGKAESLPGADAHAQVAGDLARNIMPLLQ